MTLRFFSPARRPDDEARRQAVLAGLGPIDETQLVPIVQEAADLFDARIALVTLVGESDVRIAGAVGLEKGVVPRAAAFCSHTIVEADGTLCVPSFHQDDRFAGNPIVNGPIQPHSYLGASIVVDGARVGAVCVIDPDEAAMHRPDGREQLLDLATRTAALLQGPEAGPTI